MSEGATTTQRLWSWLWALLAVAIGLNVAWALLAPLLPVLLLGGLAVVGYRWWRLRQEW